MVRFSLLLKFLGVFVVLSALFVALTPYSSFAADVEIIDSHFLTHWNVGENITFTITAKNNLAVINEVYFSAVLTNITTGQELSATPTSTSLVIGAGVNGVLSVTTNAGNRPPAGIYTVTLILFRASDDVELHRARGREPLHVGTTTDSVAAFPKMLDLGSLQYGRFMHPAPIEVSWDFYGFSKQIRKDHPWYMRLYTDNHKKYRGIDGAIYSGRVASQEGGSASAAGSPAGLVSSDGKYTIPLKVWCLNFGPDVEEGWDANLLGPPPVKEDYYWKGPLLDNGRRDASRVAWEWIPDYIDMTADSATWRKLIGQDPYNAHYVSDSNPTGDFTLTSPFEVFIAYEASPTSVAGSYSTELILEIYSP